MSYLDQLFDLDKKVAVIIGGTGELCGHMAIGLAKAGVDRCHRRSRSHES